MKEWEPLAPLRRVSPCWPSPDHEAPCQPSPEESRIKRVQVVPGVADTEYIAVMPLPCSGASPSQDSVQLT